MTSALSTRALVRALWTLLCLAFSSAAIAEPVTLVRSNGPSANRIDIVVLGDGYTAAELAAGKYATDVDTMVQGLFAQQPYSEYRNYYNVRRIDVTSVESGADHPELGTSRNTALDASYNCAGIQRLICVNTTKVSTVIANSGITTDQKDLTLVLVNDTTYGGSGGAVAVASLHPQTVELVLHETGHTFALLGDEYGGTPTCSGTEPAYPDITTQTARNSIKWKLWIGATTALPTTGTDPTIPGLFVGGNYCDSGYFRPSYDSKMRTLGVPFYQVNQEAHVLRVYNFVSPIDGSSPAGTSVTAGPSQTFTITPTVPFSHALTITWAVDGVQQGTGSQFTPGLTAGTHTITATVSDTTAWVRNDPAGVMSDVRTWTVTAQSSGPGAFAKVSPASGATGQATSVSLSWGSSSGAAAYEYCIDTTNDNACTAWTSAGTATSVVVSNLSAGTTYYWHVRASASGSTTYADGASTAFRNFTTQVVPPGAFAKSSPASGATGQATNPTLSWGASTGASTYEYCIDTTNDNACAAWVSTGASTSATLSGLTAGTAYYWQARATSAGGTTYADGASTAFRSFTTQVTPPGAFAKTAPANGATALGTSLSLSWGASTGVSSYEYCIDTTNDNACAAWVSTGASTSAVLSGLNAGTAYYWQARATNAGGTTYADGASTAFRSFTTQVALPGVFAKTSPANGAVALGTSLSLSWGASTGASSYEYCLDTTNDNACAAWVSAGASTSVALSGLSDGTTYYWQVRAINPGGTTYADGVATSYANFATPVAPPGAFSKTSPVNGATALATGLTLTWTASGGASSYEYCVDTTNDNACATWVSTSTSTNVALSSLSDGTTYYWQVRAINPGSTTYADGVATSYANFATPMAPPGAFSKTSPVNGATALATGLTLTWTASGGASSYEYCVDTTNDNACATWVSTSTSTNVALSSLSDGTTYYWQVRAINPGGTTYADGVATSYANFATPMAPPGAFSKTSPVNGATALATGLTLTWTASGGASSYEYCVDTTNDNACATWVSTGGSTSVALTGLTGGTTYYWQVRATNTAWTTYADGAMTAFASVGTQGAMPGPFTKLAPASEAVGLAMPVLVSWAPSTGVSRYEYCVDTTNDDACSASWVNVNLSRSAVLVVAPGTTYYWQVRAVNAFGTTYSGGSSNVYRSFTTKGVAAPGAFSKTSPVNGATALATGLTLTWTASGGASSYEYCVDTTNDNTCATWVSTSTSTNVALSGLSDGTTYYWQVRAINPGGTTYADGVATSYANFATPVAPPGAFSKTSPVNGATALAAGLTLTWTASGGASSYEYCVDTTNDNACATWVSTSTSTNVALSSLSDGTTYYWQVRASNPGGVTYADGATTSYAAFTTQVAAPGAFVKTSPVTAATG